MAADPASAPKTVRDQYEAHPYPLRDPADEATRLITGSPSRVAELNHYVFAGRRDFSRPFRVLVAGGGTGDATVQLAQQLADRGCPAEILHLDLSEAAMAIADARVAARNLTSVRFQHGSLLDVAAIAPGPWDYIDCCGVLHHLPQPDAGIRALASVLAPDGGIGLMVYADLGRTGVYDVQDMLRTLLVEDRKTKATPKAELAVAKRLLTALPDGNRLKRNLVVSDHLKAGDAGLYDLLLHSIDRAYRVPALFDLVEGAGLAISGLIDPVLYDPGTWIADKALLDRLASRPWRDRAGFAELAAGTLKKHVAYAVPVERARQAIAPFGPDAIPVPDDFDASGLAARIKPGRRMTIQADGVRMSAALPPMAGPILRLTDGRRSLAEIHEILPTAPGGAKLSRDQFLSQAEMLFRLFNGSGRLFLALVPC